MGSVLAADFLQQHMEVAPKVGHPVCYYQIERVLHSFGERRCPKYSLNGLLEGLG